MSAMASQITGVSMVCSTVCCSGADQRKHESSASLAFVREINRWPLDSPHKGPVTRIMFPLDDVAPKSYCFHNIFLLRIWWGIWYLNDRCLSSTNSALGWEFSKDVRVTYFRNNVLTGLWHFVPVIDTGVDPHSTYVTSLNKYYFAHKRSPLSCLHRHNNMH